MRVLKDYSKSLSLRSFTNLHKKVVIVRDTGGLGDILMHRMIFEDFKKQMPECHLTFTCPNAYHTAVSDHPYVDQVIDSREMDENQFGVVYNTTTICGKYEMALAPHCPDHRSDIWSNHCGLELINHNMHFHLTPEEIAFGHKKLKELGNGKYALISPKSAMVSKDLDNLQVAVVVDYLKAKGFLPFILHNNKLKMNLCPELSHLTIREWLAVIYNSDLVISVDTATFHAAGGLGKPLLGVFSWSDGLVYGKYFDTILVQKHRQLDADWTCGPCYKWFDCPKCPQMEVVRKPCITEIDRSMLEGGLSKLLEKF
jgi:ADP-heptose:LPS heptosyltransferase